jgi:hypothetical protein
MIEEERPPVPNGISPFERIRRTNVAGAEYWSSRDFAQVLGYSDYRNFGQVILKARAACFNSGQRIEDHFVDITEMVADGIMPENFPPAESIKKLESKRQKKPKALKRPPGETDMTSDLNKEGGMCRFDPKAHRQQKKTETPVDLWVRNISVQRECFFT